jgi:hypothetical protein
MVNAILKSKVETILEELPPDGQEELAEFLDFLAEKYQVEPKRNIIALGGIWEHTPLDISDDEVRKLRADTSKRIMKKLSTVW